MDVDEAVTAADTAGATVAIRHTQEGGEGEFVALHTEISVSHIAGDVAAVSELPDWTVSLVLSYTAKYRRSTPCKGGCNRMRPRLLPIFAAYLLGKRRIRYSL